MKKTFYSVKYAVLGSLCGPMTKWFDNLGDAKKFSRGDFRDGVISHTYKNPYRIKEMDEMIKRIKTEEEYDEKIWR